MEWCNHHRQHVIKKWNERSLSRGAVWRWIMITATAQHVVTYMCTLEHTCALHTSLLWPALHLEYLVWYFFVRHTLTRFPGQKQQSSCTSHRPASHLKQNEFLADSPVPGDQTASLLGTRVGDNFCHHQLLVLCISITHDRTNWIVCQHFCWVTTMSIFCALLSAIQLTPLGLFGGTVINDLVVVFMCKCNGIN